MAILMFLLTSCHADLPQRAEPTANPFACQGRERPQATDEYRFTLDCSCINSVSSGPSWCGLTIGSSTLEDVQSVLGAEGVHDSQDDSWDFWQLEGKIDWNRAEACFVDEKLSALYVGVDLDLYRLTLEQIIAKYGTPERVTWGGSYQNRAFIWPEQGMLIFISVSGEHPGGSILLYSPIPSDALETSWLLTSLPDGPVGSPPDDVVTGPEYEMEDPWGIEH